MSALRKVITAFLTGIWLLASDFRALRLAIFPWAMTLFFSALSALAGVYAFHPIYSFVQSHLEVLPSWLSPIMAVIIATIGLGLTIIVGGFTIGVTLLVLIQEPLARHIRAVRKQPIPTSQRSVGGTTNAIIRSLLMCISTLPLMLLGIVLTFIPPLTLLGIIISAWTLTLQAFDPVFEVDACSVRERWRKGWNNRTVFVLFGLVLIFLSAIPFAWTVLPLIGVVAAASFERID